MTFSDNEKITILLLLKLGEPTLEENKSITSCKTQNRVRYQLSSEIELLNYKFKIKVKY